MTWICIENQIPIVTVKYNFAERCSKEFRNDGGRTIRRNSTKFLPLLIEEIFVNEEFED